MKWFDYARPLSLREAVALLAQKDQRARVMAGGTDILVQLRAGRRDVDLLVDCKAIPELNELTCDSEGGLTLGAAVPCHRIHGDRVVRAAYPGLVDSASLIGGTLVQARATLGGNLCNAAPSADSIPIMIALKGICKIMGPDGAREVPVEDFCTGPGQTILRPGELLVSLRFPPPEPSSGAHYMRFTPRNEMDIAVAGAGVSVLLDNGAFASARIALSAVAPTPLFAREAGEALKGRPINEDSIRMASEMAAKTAKPIADMRGSAEYRTHLCEVLTRRALNVAIQRAKEAR